MQVHAALAWLWRFETSRENLWVQEAVKSKHIKVVKIAREVNAADSLACFSATHILRDHETRQLRADRQPGTRSCRSELSLAYPAVTVLGIKDCQAEGAGEGVCVCW